LSVSLVGFGWLLLLLLLLSKRSFDEDWGGRKSQREGRLPVEKKRKEKKNKEKKYTRYGLRVLS